MINREDLPKDVQEMFDGLHAVIKFSRWAYECAIKEGFTEAQAMEIAKSYIHAMMNVASVAGGKKA